MPGVRATGLLTFILALLSCGPEVSGPQPYVILVTLDTTRVDYLGCYNDARPLTPHLDAVARSGVRFENAMAQAAVTPVSHASILTGQNPYTHGLRVLHGTRENRLSNDAVTLAEVLKAAGYRTGAFLSAFPVSRRFGFDQGFDHFDDDFLADVGSAPIDQGGFVNTRLNQRRGDVTTLRALRWLEQQSPDAPVFLWAHYFDPHDPALLPPAEFVDAYPVHGSSESERLRRLYEIEMRFMDLAVGDLLDGVQAAAGERDVVVAVVSDHGEGLGDHGWWTHGVLYQEQIHVPMFVRAPGLPSGVSIDALVRTIDLMPTLLALVLPANEPPRMDGTSLVPLLRGEVSDPDLVAYADSVNQARYRFGARSVEHKRDLLFAIAHGRWKYIHHLLDPGASELYDLEQDPDESRNLATARPDRLADLLGRLQAADFLPREYPAADRMSAEDRERLRSLGYVR